MKRGFLFWDNYRQVSLSSRNKTKLKLLIVDCTTESNADQELKKYDKWVLAINKK